MSRRVLGLAAGLLAAPALILSPQGISALEKAGFAQPSLSLEKRLPLTMSARTARIRRNTPTKTSFVVEYITGNQTTMNGMSAAFSSTPLGDEAEDRRFVIVVFGRPSAGSTVVDDVRIGAPSGQFNLLRQSAGSNGWCQIWLSNVAFPTGLTGTINLGSPAIQVCYGFNLWRVTGMTTFAALDTATTTTNGATMTLSPFPAGAVLIGASQLADTASCTVGAGATELHDRTIESSLMSACVAQSSGNTVSFEWTASTNFKAIAVALR